jgi:curli biogenesis system outer membrane secretion channel CsgG
MRFFGSCFVLFAFAALACLSCASGGTRQNAGTAPAETMPAEAERGFDGAVEACAREIEGSLASGVSVAVVGFESSSKEISGDVMEEFMGHLVKSKKLKVADRANLELIINEQQLSMSGHISDETAISIGKMVGAMFVITGSLTDRGDSYRLRVTAINTETAIREAFSSTNISKTSR